MFTRERLTRWTASLRKNIHRQDPRGGVLQTFEGLQCCLGHLCELEGIEFTSHKDSVAIFSFPPINPSESWMPSHIKDTTALAGKLAKDFGSETGDFSMLKMPGLKYNINIYTTAAIANDAQVPWNVIADHFDKYYPCSDDNPEDYPNSHPIKS